MYERYSRQVLGFCVNQLGSPDEAEDAVQSTFLNAHRALQRGVTPEAELAWLFKIAHNVCLTRRRSTRRRGRVEAPSDLDAVQDVLPAPARESTDELIRLTDALAHMPDNQRRAILLREWQGLSYHEIAHELQLSQSAVETLIFRARRTLASNLEVEPERPSALARMRRLLDIGSLLGALKTLLAAGTAVQATAAAVAVTGAAVVATSPAVHHHPLPAKHTPAHASVRPNAPAAVNVEPIAAVEVPTRAVAAPARHASKPKPKLVRVKPVVRTPAPAPAVHEIRVESPAPAVPTPSPAASPPTEAEQAKDETPATPDKAADADHGDKNGKGAKGSKKGATSTTNFVPPLTPPASKTTDAAVPAPAASEEDEKSKDKDKKDKHDD